MSDEVDFLCAPSDSDIYCEFEADECFDSFDGACCESAPISSSGIKKRDYEEFSVRSPEPARSLPVSKKSKEDTTLRDKMESLLQLQAFNGSWDLSQDFAKVEYIILKLFLLFIYLFI